MDERSPNSRSHRLLVLVFALALVLLAAAHALTDDTVGAIVSGSLSLLMTGYVIVEPLLGPGATVNSPQIATRIWKYHLPGPSTRMFLREWERGTLDESDDPTFRCGRDDQEILSEQCRKMR